MNWYKQAVIEDLSIVIFSILQRAKTDDMHQEDLTSRFSGEDRYKLKQALDQAQGMMGFGRGVAPNQAQMDIIQQIQMIADGTDPNLQMNNNQSQQGQVNEDYLGLSGGTDVGTSAPAASQSMQSNISM